MAKILIFGGTTEGHALAKQLAEAGLSTIVCVATEYGEMVLPKLEQLEIRTGRLGPDEMRKLYDTEELLAIVDATHPFATAVTKNIRESLSGRPIPKFRLERSVAENADDNLQIFADSASCAEALTKTHGNILLTTGSKELSVFCANENVRERIFARVLPGLESIELCYASKLSGKQILAMQGPFDEEMNLAMLRSLHIQTLVTKQSGTAGGLEEKLRAAQKAGVSVFLIAKPEEGTSDTSWTTGPYEEILSELEKLTSTTLRTPTPLQVTLAGIGPGNRGLMTMALAEAIKECDLVFGAKRMLEAVQGELCPKAKQYPYYLSRDILPVLSEAAASGAKQAVVLFSGDTGFFSGCAKLREALGELPNIKVRVLPGISSMSYLAARAGISYQDATVVSAHGTQEAEWTAAIEDALAANEKVFFLTTGPEDVRKIAKLAQNCRIILGYELSYPKERVEELSADECAKITEPGLYVGFVLR